MSAANSIWSAHSRALCLVPPFSGFSNDMGYCFTLALDLSQCGYHLSRRECGLKAFVIFPLSATGFCLPGDIVEVGSVAADHHTECDNSVESTGLGCCLRSEWELKSSGYDERL